MISIIIPTVPGNEEMLQRCVNSIIKQITGEYELIIIKNNFWGFAKAINKGLEKTNNDVILLNDDTIVVGWLDDFIKASKKYDIIGQRGYMRPEHFPFWGVYIKKEVISKIGFLDERFEIGEYEDVDYCIRAIDAGFKLGETEWNFIIHPFPSRTLTRLSKEKQEKIKLNKQKFLDKWKGTRWEKRITGEEW